MPCVSCSSSSLDPPVDPSFPPDLTPFPDYRGEAAALYESQTILDLEKLGLITRDNGKFVIVEDMCEHAEVLFLTPFAYISHLVRPPPPSPPLPFILPLPLPPPFSPS